MVAIEVLNDPEMAWLSGSFSQTSLLTMGSPITYLYQTYFGHLYPSLNSPQWDNLRTRVDRWVNMFRIDDFVGQEIDFPIIGRSLQAAPMLAKDSSATTQSCTDHPLGCRGHTNYWEDIEAIAVIKTEIFAIDRTQNNRRAA